MNVKEAQPMKLRKRLYCRLFQAGLKIALPFLPYRTPKAVGSVRALPKIIRRHRFRRPLIVTDKGIRGLGLIRPLEKALTDEGLSYRVYDKTSANPTTDNVEEAVRLYRTGIVEKILITGDPTSILQDDGTSTADLFLAYMEQMGVERSAFILEQKALNTRQNAVNVGKMLGEMGIGDRECLLVTSATHMRRSAACFAKVGLKPDLLAVSMPERPSRLNHRAFYPTWDAALKWEEIMNEWIGDIAYRIAGYV